LLTTFVAVRHGGFWLLRARREKARGYSAATTTATARDAAQINCAALSEQELDAGGHATQLT
jgi:hypothetical protein